DADIAREVDLMSEIPRVAVRHDDDRLRSMRLGVAEHIERRRGARLALARNDSRLRGVNVNTAREILAVAEQHERTERRVVLVLIVSRGQPQPRRRIDPALNERAVE